LKINIYNIYNILILDKGREGNLVRKKSAQTYVLKRQRSRT